LLKHLQIKGFSLYLPHKTDKMSLKMIRILFFTSSVLFSINTLKAQFITNGTARLTSERCWTLTPAQNTVVGSVWNETKINLNESFDVSLDVFLGCKDATGADGLVFGFQPVSTSIGSTGEGLGFGGVQPSIGIEIDTWQNSNQNDPPNDHVAIISNGIVNHSSSTNLAGPKSIGSGGNIEDCQFHDLRVVWDAKKKKLELFWDCNPLLSYTGDIVKDIFNGDPLVYWGFTAATGGANNEHKICLKYSSFLSDLPDTTICVGGQVKLAASNGVSYKWSPEMGLSSTTIPDPIAKPDKTTEYKVVITDKCGRQYADSLIVKVGGSPITFDLGRDTSLCEGQVLPLSPNIPDAKYRWQDGSTAPVFNADTSGFFKVLVEKNFCFASDSIRLRYIKPPSVELGVDTTLCLNKKLILKAKGENASFQWQDETYLNSYVVLQAGTYYVVAKNQCGEVSDAIRVDYEDCRQAYIPNAFSPNGDGVNETFMIYSGNDVVKIKSLQIFDRWGGMVFSAKDFLPNDLAVAWDGKDMQTGVYSYIVEILFKDGEMERRKGDVNLMR
jgi:gliding motility-associated-like protein